MNLRERISLLICHLIFICSCVPGLLFTVWSGDAAAADDLAKQIQKLDGRVILRGTLSRKPMAAMLSRYVEAELREANHRDRQAWNAVTTKADWEEMRDRRLAALRTSLGQFPEVAEDLKVRVVRTTSGDGFHVDNLLFESRPGIMVTANLYRPAKPSSSMPGLVVCHSHIRPKETGARQLMGATWARAGCVVLVPDHLGHGERRQHPFRSESDYGKPFRVSSQDYYFRYDAGIQLHLIGDSLMGWLAWDLWRGVDVLLNQPGVDPKRIVMISEPAGGGDVAAVAAALDGRIAGVMVNNFGGPEPENGYPLPQDAETWFPYTASGSWESTRNLRLSARDGFLPWTIVASMAPRRLIYYHEFYWDREQDPVWKRIQRIYGSYAAADSVTGLAGHGFVVGSSPENTHWTPHSRELLYPTLERWFGIPNPGKEHDQLIPEEKLQCLTTPGTAPIESIPLYKLCSHLGTDRGLAARRTRSSFSPVDRTRQLRMQWTQLLGDVESPHEPVVLRHDHESVTNVVIERIQLGTEPGIVVPVLLLVPESESARRIVVAVAQSGKQQFLQRRSDEIAALLKAGTAVCLLDLRGTGETAPSDERGRRSAASSLSSSELMLGQTLVGDRLRDLRQVVQYLRVRDDLDPNHVALWGDSFAKTNAADCNFAVPRGIPDRPYQSEPAGGLLVLLCALFDEAVEAVYVHGGLTGFQDALTSPFCYLPHDVVIPGVLTSGDMCDVAAAIAPRRLRLDSLVDGSNRRESIEQVRRTYEAATVRYRQADANEQFDITNDGQSIAEWLLRSSR